jgi:hypothetical protein
MEKFKLIKIPTHKDERGILSVVELKDFVDWEVKRVYYVTDVTAGRGGHAVRGEKKIYIMMQGKATARIHDGAMWHELSLLGPSDAILMEEMCWREFIGFSKGAVLCAISNMNYERDKYIYDFEEYLNESRK